MVEKKNPLSLLDTFDVSIKFKKGYAPKEIFKTARISLLFHSPTKRYSISASGSGQVILEREEVIKIIKAILQNENL